MSIEYSLDGGLARIYINRPEKHNALTREMREELADRMEQASSDPAVRAVLLSARGPNFFVSDSACSMSGSPVINKTRPYSASKPAGGESLSAAACPSSLTAAGRLPLPN